MFNPTSDEYKLMIKSLTLIPATPMVKGLSRRLTEELSSVTANEERIRKLEAFEQTAEGKAERAYRLGLPTSLLPEFDKLVESWPSEFSKFVDEIGRCGGTPYHDLDYTMSTWLKLKYRLVDDVMGELLGWFHEQEFKSYPKPVSKALCEKYRREYRLQFVGDSNRALMED